MKLTDYFEDVAVIDGEEYKIDMAFDNILRFYELYEDDEVNDHDKIEFMFQILIFDSEELVLELEQKKEIIEQIILTHITGSEGEEDKKNDPSEAQDEEIKKKEYDLSIDAELIYSSFIYDYRIDLFEEQGKLHWKKFMALLNGLSEKSPFMKIVNIRTCEIPKPTKHNGKERARMLKLKMQYSLEKQDMQDGLNKTASFLRSKAKEKVGDHKK